MTTPIDMVLHCPKCGTQHIDAQAPCSMSVGCEEAGVCFAAAHSQPERCEAWDNPPHRSHLCHNCGFIWRPADVPTNGVAAVKTRGKDDHEIVDLASQIKKLRDAVIENHAWHLNYDDHGGYQGSELYSTNASALGHALFKDGDTDMPPQILDRNGQVVLSMCKLCRKVESELDEACDPGFLVYVNMQKRGDGKVYADMHKTDHRIYFTPEEAQAAIDADPEIADHRHVVPIVCNLYPEGEN